STRTKDGDAFTGNGEGDGSRQTREKHDGATAEKDRSKRHDSGEKKFHLSKKTLIIGGIVLGVILIGVFLYWLHARNFVSTDDAYTTTHVHEISARVAGTVEHVNVDDNQFVHGAQPLVMLDQRDFKVAVEQARAQASQRRAAGDEAQANQTHAQQDYNRFTDLGSKKVVSKQDVDNATAALKTANGALNAAKADLAAAQAALANAELQLSYTTIVAPADGRIAKKTVETGAHIQPGQALMAVVEQNVWLLGNFKETQLKRMRVGQHVDVKIDAIPDHVFSAHIDSLQPGTGSTFALLPPDNATGNFTKIVQRVPVKVVFDDVGKYRERVVPGLSCEPKVDLRTGPRQ
ncbi:MAG TPA: HlyD family secretion protein, partial [Candidatus Udaeobacter sp.]|nr:HlyD family secretion protein [Candidatus Udaeobacter sp.]